MKKKKRVLLFRQDEKAIYIKINKKAFWRMMHKTFWLLICLATMVAILFWCLSVNALQNLTVTANRPVYEVWENAKVPLLVFFGCSDWFCLMIAIFYFANRNRFKRHKIIRK